jgi:hypothetical protein
MYIDKLVSDVKFKAILMKGVNFVSERAWAPFSKTRFHEIDLDIGRSKIDI